MSPAPLDYLLGEEVTLVTAPAVLGAQVSLRSEPLERVERTFYDTFDGRLHAAGRACLSEGGRLALFEGDGTPGREIASVALADEPEQISPLELPSSALRDALVELVEVRALLRVARVRSRRRTLAVLDDLQKTVVRIVVEQPVAVREDGRGVRLAARLRLAPVRGYEPALERLRHVLESRFGLSAAPGPLLEEAVLALGGVSGGVSAKVDVALEGSMRADVAAALVLRRLLEIMRANLPGTIAELDPEFLHDFRVAVRRSRAVQRELRDVFPAAPLARFRAEFRRLQQITSDVRDLDVYVIDFDDFRAQLPQSAAADLDPLLLVLRKRRAAAHRAMTRALRSARTRALLADWEAFLEEVGGGQGSGDAVGAPGPEAASTIAEIAGGRIGKVYRRMVRMGGAITPASPADDYHELRKQGKELRYLLELFGAAFPDDVVKPMVRVLKSLQDCLGRHQDREVQIATLRSLGEEVADEPGGAAGLMAMGMLVERLKDEEVAARAEFAERFAAFASKSQRQLVRDTFN
jgi:CHAD domain-containing protein